MFQLALACIFLLPSIGTNAAEIVSDIRQYRCRAKALDDKIAELERKAA